MEDSMRARICFVAVSFLLGLFALSPVQAQVTTADLVGTVTDSSGAVVISAQVTATNEGTGLTRTAQTDAAGNYLISQLAPGRYSVTCELAGFKKLIQTGVELQVNQRAQINLVLEVGEVNQVVEVQGTAPLLESKSSVLGSVISETKVQAMPMNCGYYVKLTIHRLSV